MAALGNKNMATFARKNQEGSPRNSQSRHSAVLSLNEKYDMQVSEEIEGRATKKLYQELRRTEARSLCALPNLDELLLNPQVRVQSGTVLTSRKAIVENQEPTNDHSQKNPRPELDASIYRCNQSMDSDL